MVQAYSHTIFYLYTKVTFVFCSYQCRPTIMSKSVFYKNVIINFTYRCLFNEINQFSKIYFPKTIQFFLFFL